MSPSCEIRTVNGSGPIAGVTCAPVVRTSVEPLTATWAGVAWKPAISPRPEPENPFASSTWNMRSRSSVAPAPPTGLGIATRSGVSSPASDLPSSRLTTSISMPSSWSRIMVCSSGWNGFRIEVKNELEVTSWKPFSVMSIDSISSPSARLPGLVPVNALWLTVARTTATTLWAWIVALVSATPITSMSASRASASIVTVTSTPAASPVAAKRGGAWRRAVARTSRAKFLRIGFFWAISA